MSDFEAPPLLSTPATHILESHKTPSSDLSRSNPSPEEIYLKYEIQRTIDEIKKSKWKRVALQFPDSMLPDAPAVFDALERRMQNKPTDGKYEETEAKTALESGAANLNISISHDVRFYILGDTSYGECCVDEIAAEHVNADAIVHYGRACLSPSARLPVLYVFTKQPLAVDHVVEAFKSAYPDRQQRIVLIADVIYANHLETIEGMLKSEQYTSVYRTDIVHNPSSPLPNRTVPASVLEHEESLQEWSLFYLSEPSQSLLLTLYSRISNIHIYPITSNAVEGSHKAFLTSAAVALRRRYALLMSVSTVPIFGILVNTLSVKNYVHIVELVKSQIAAAGKKSYLFVVGKINPAKVANFSEIGAWVVIGCWESSLIDSKDFWKPIVTPFELGLSLKKDDERIWTGEWSSDFQRLLDQSERQTNSNGETDEGIESVTVGEHNSEEENEEEESAPPEFDLRTGRYVANTKPTKVVIVKQPSDFQDKKQKDLSQSLIKRAKGEIAIIGGDVSPGAEYLRSKRTWKGLGSDFELESNEPHSQGAVLEEGRKGIARGYTNAHQPSKT
ncbi:MAG: hypothetical protein Q9190_000281 [Brigantiaea leucoxantha]